MQKELHQWVFSLFYGVVWSFLFQVGKEAMKRSGDGVSQGRYGKADTNEKQNGNRRRKEEPEVI